jgi:hypothetical protein
MFRKPSVPTAHCTQFAGGYSKKLLEELLIWYEKHQTTNKLGHKSIKHGLSRLVPGSVITLDDLELDDDDSVIMMLDVLLAVLGALAALLAALAALLAVTIRWLVWVLIKFTCWQRCVSDKN